MAGVPDLNVKALLVGCAVIGGVVAIILWELAWYLFGYLFRNISIVWGQ